MNAQSKDGSQHQVRPGTPEHFEQIDPNRKDQHRPAGNSPDREDENLKGARKHNDPVPDVEMTKPVGHASQPGQPGESAAGGFEEGPMTPKTPDDKKK